MKVSIGIPIYNAEEYLDYAIKSVLAQTYEDWELILIDDGSTDSSLSIAKKYESQDKRIRVISDGLNKKLPTRLNQIIDESKYEYIARMDADDIMHPQRIEIQLKFLEKNHDFDLVSSGLVSINKINEVRGYRCVNAIYTNFSDQLRRNPIVHPSVFGRKSWFLRNKYNPKYPRCEDYELWCRATMNKDFKMAILPDLLIYYREEGNINAKKLIDSYNDSLKIYTSYYGKLSFKKLANTMLKKLAVITLEKSGQLQILSKIRNKNKMKESEIHDHQLIINKILESSPE